MNSKLKKTVGLFAILPLIGFATIPNYVGDVFAEGNGPITAKVSGKAKIVANDLGFVLKYKILDETEILDEPAIATVRVKITDPGDQGSVVNVLYGDEIVGSISAHAPRAGHVTFSVGGTQSIFVVDANLDGTGDNDIGGFANVVIKSDS